MKNRCSLLLAAAALALAGCASGPTMQAAPAPTPTAPGQIAAGKTEVLWLGQATVRITTPGGKVIVIDPWLTANPKAPAEWKRLEALGKVDAILVTHAHSDHFADAPALARMHNVPVYNAGGMGQAIVSLGILPAPLVQRFGKGGTIAPFGPAGAKITAVRAEHASELVWKNATTGKDETHFGGEPVGYIIEMENGFKLWHMGDTAAFGDMRLIAETHKPDLVLVPIGGYFTMGAPDAAMAVRDLIKPKFAIPVHYGTFAAMTGTPAAFGAALGTGPGAPRMIVLEPGQKADF
jgi:L-ascorbate metabolism protein UlaG (beta-lactamase superfamily)